uniref:Major facilitator superfamily (MFS) profile domain-containing protein n=1 Tax=Caenorhabditis japonica TaxID=281687 RepID=A0A8R1EJK5_CAEJA
MEKTLDVTNLPAGTSVYKWTVDKAIAQGDFSFIYACIGSSNMSHHKQFALKCESAQSPLQMLKVEAFVLQKISKRGSRHFCDVEDIGKFQGIHYIVMHLVGRALVIGRRPLLISSLLILALINILMMSLFFFYESSKDPILAWPFLALFILFTFVFNIGIGPAAVFIGAELAPPGTISKMQSISTSVQFLGSFICPVIYISLVDSFGGLAFLIFIIPLTITAAYFYLYLPETKGKTADEINKLLLK